MKKLKPVDESGQTVVEYMLLLAVSISLVMTFYNSALYKRLFGNSGTIGEAIKSESEFNYRHAFPAQGQTDSHPRTERNGAIHPSYYDNIFGGSRFFGSVNKYPQ